MNFYTWHIASTLFSFSPFPSRNSGVNSIHILTTTTRWPWCVVKHQKLSISYHLFSVSVQRSFILLCKMDDALEHIAVIHSTEIVACTCDNISHVSATYLGSNCFEHLHHIRDNKLVRWPLIAGLSYMVMAGRHSAECLYPLSPSSLYQMYQLRYQGSSVVT